MLYDTCSENCVSESHPFKLFRKLHQLIVPCDTTLTIDCSKFYRCSKALLKVLKECSVPCILATQLAQLVAQGPGATKEHACKINQRLQGIGHRRSISVWHMQYTHAHSHRSALYCFNLRLKYTIGQYEESDSAIQSAKSPASRRQGSNGLRVAILNQL
jgi:hypothetical protein